MRGKIGHTAQIVFQFVNIGVILAGIVIFFFGWNLSGLLLSYLAAVAYIAMTIKFRQLAFIQTWIELEQINGSTMDNVLEILKHIADQKSARLEGDMDIIKKLNGLN